MANKYNDLQRKVLLNKALEQFQRLENKKTQQKDFTEFETATYKLYHQLFFDSRNLKAKLLNRRTMQADLTSYQADIIIGTHELDTVLHNKFISDAEKVQAIKQYQTAFDESLLMTCGKWLVVGLAALGGGVVGAAVGFVVGALATLCAIAMSEAVPSLEVLMILCGIGGAIGGVVGLIWAGAEVGAFCHREIFANSNYMHSLTHGLTDPVAREATNLFKSPSKRVSKISENVAAADQRSAPALVSA